MMPKLQRVRRNRNSPSNTVSDWETEFLTKKQRKHLKQFPLDLEEDTDDKSEADQPGTFTEWRDKLIQLYQSDQARMVRNAVSSGLGTPALAPASSLYDPSREFYLLIDGLVPPANRKLVKDVKILEKSNIANWKDFIKTVAQVAPATFADVVAHLRRFESLLDTLQPQGTCPREILVMDQGYARRALLRKAKEVQDLARITEIHYVDNWAEKLDRGVTRLRNAEKQCEKLQVWGGFKEAKDIWYCSKMETPLCNDPDYVRNVRSFIFKRLRSELEEFYRTGSGKRRFVDFWAQPFETVTDSMALLYQYIVGSGKFNHPLRSGPTTAIYPYHALNIMQDLIWDVPRFSQSVTLYRAFQPGTPFANAFLASLQPGKTIQMDGFNSTTPDLNYEFLGKECCAFVFTIPPNYPMLPIFLFYDLVTRGELLENYEKYDREVLLPHGICATVREVKEKQVFPRINADEENQPRPVTAYYFDVLRPRYKPKASKVMTKHCKADYRILHLSTIAKTYASRWVKGFRARKQKEQVQKKARELKIAKQLLKLQGGTSFEEWFPKFQQFTKELAAKGANE